MRLPKVLVCFLALVLCAARFATAQNETSQTTSTETGSISGNVHDPTGALVPGATVTITNDKGFSQVVTADDQGNYVVTGLAPGTYKVTVTVQGFKTLEIPSTVVTAGQAAHADAALEVVGATASVNVIGQRAAQVETENPQLSGTITQQEVTSIGLNGRNFTQLITLAPGVSNQTGQDEALVGVKGSVKYSVNGGRVEYNNFDVDGSDVLNAGINGSQSTLIVYPSLDAIQEVKVLTSNYGAQYGRSASGTVLVTTKSGGNQFHGDIYEFARNEIFNAKGFFDIGNREPPLYRRHDFGGTIGGPLFIPNHYNTSKDKTFFFFSQDFRTEKTPTEFNQGVPSLGERNGYFGDVCPFAPPGVEVVFLRVTFPDCPAIQPNATSGYYNSFPGNQLTIDPNAELIMQSLIPAPTATTGCNSSIASCYDAAVSVPTHWREELVRIDHNFTPNVKATGRFIYDSWNTINTTPEWGFIQNSFPTVENRFVGPGIDVVTHVNEIISPTLFNDTVVSFTTDEISLTDINGTGGTCTGVNCDWQRPAGLSSGLTLFNNGFGGKVPGIVIAGTNAAYGGYGFSVDPSFEPYHHSNPTFAIGDDLTKTVGNHTITTGFQSIFAQKIETNPAIGAATGDMQGIITFSNENSNETTGNAFADFLIGRIKAFQQDSGQAEYHDRYTTVEPYVQDDWHVKPRLTLNLGLRLSLFGTYNEKNLQAYNWFPSAFNPALAAQASVDPYSGALVLVSTCTNPMNPPAVSVGNTCSPVPLGSYPQNPSPYLINGQVRCGTDGTPRACMKGHIFNPAPRIGFAWDPKGDGKTSIRAGYGIFFEHGTGNEANTGSLEGSAPLVLDMTEDNFTLNGSAYSCVQFACIPGVTSPLAFPPNTTFIPTKAVWPYVQQWNLSVQRQLTPDLVATAAYVGSKGTHLTAELQINQLHAIAAADNPFIPGQPITNSVCDTFAGFGSSFQVNGNIIASGDPGYTNLVAACHGIGSDLVDPNSLRTYAPTLGQIFSLQNVANSNYNGAQVTLRRAKAPLTLELAYSYSHSIDDSSDRFDSTLADAFDLRENRASSNFDQRHLLNISYVYDFSFIRVGQLIRDSWNGHGLHPDNKPSPSSDPPSFFQRIFDDWEFTGVTTYQSGTPFTVINGGSAGNGISVLDNPGVASGTGAGSYPDKVLNAHFTDPLVGGANSAAFTFGPLLGDPNAFAAPQGLTFGDAGRDSMNNPSRFNFDMALLKHFKIKESATLELRAEAFNIFNTTQFRIYDPDRGNNANNVISCYGGPDNVAGFVGSGTDCLIGNAFLRPVDAHRPRTIQLGAKILF